MYGNHTFSGLFIGVISDYTVVLVKVLNGLVKGTILINTGKSSIIQLNVRLFNDKKRLLLFNAV